MKLKLNGQRPTRSVLRDDNGRFDEISQNYPKQLPIFTGGEPCTKQFSVDISGLCDSIPSTFIDVKGNLIGKNQEENNFIERKYTGCWERDEYDFKGFTETRPPTPAPTPEPTPKPTPMPTPAPTPKPGKGGKGKKRSEKDL